MGSALSRTLMHLFGQKDARLLILGLDAAGKTTMLYKMRLGEMVTTIPTIGFNVETLYYKRTTFVVWDVGGRDKTRALWRHYYQGTDGVIFVVDANDRERLQDAREDLDRIFGEDILRDCPVLVFANKQDLPNAAPAAVVTEALGLHRYPKRAWYVQPCSIVLSEGIAEGMEWIAQQISLRAVAMASPFPTTTSSPPLSSSSSSSTAPTWLARIKSFFSSTQEAIAHTVTVTSPPPSVDTIVTVPPENAPAAMHAKPVTMSESVSEPVSESDSRNDDSTMVMSNVVLAHE